MAIDWLLEANLAAVARLLRMTWAEADGIRSRAVERGLARREAQPVSHLGVDETSFQKGHEYVTVVSDLDDARVLHLADGHDQAALQNYYENDMPTLHRFTINAALMDMHRPYIAATKACFADAKKMIAFDRFHVAKNLNERVDEVRRSEQRELAAVGDNRLNRTKYWFLKKPESLEQMDAARLAGMADMDSCGHGFWNCADAEGRSDGETPPSRHCERGGAASDQ